MLKRERKSSTPSSKKIKHVLFFLLFHLSLFSELICLPDEFFVVERFLSFASSFDVLTNLEPIASAEKEWLGHTSCFEIKTDSGELIATTKEHFFSLATVAEVYDSKGNKIGKIHEEIFRIFPWCQYRVYNQEGKISALAKMNFLGTKFYLTHPEDESILYAIISRSLIKFIRDCWTVQICNREIFEREIVDSRILIALAIYQTDKDNRDYYRNLFFSQLRGELELFEGNRLDSFSN